MAVLVELLTLVVPRAALAARPDARAAALAAGPVQACDDGHLVALTFDASARAHRALDALAAAGLHPWVGEAGDEEPGAVGLLDQRAGPLGWWPWLELGHLSAPEEDGGLVGAARLAGTAGREVVVPAGWRLAGSASERLGPLPLRLPDRPLRHLRREPSGDRYRDLLTGEEPLLPRRCAPERLVVLRGAAPLGEVRAEVVQAWEEIEVGLMFRERLADGEGMLFRFARARPHGFWMKNTLVALDLLFLDAAGRVVNVEADARPLTTRHRRSAGPVSSVLEVPGGWCARHGVAAGDRVAAAGAAVEAAP
jgi:uncharacterized membrane protein (UPF0127 family)